MLEFRRSELAGVAVYGGIALMVVLGAVGVGVWFLVHEDENVRVEVSIVDVDLRADPAPAEIGVRVTSKISVELWVEDFRMRVWTDGTKEHFVLEERGGDLLVPAGDQVVWYFHVELHNLDHVDDALYIEFDMTYRAGAGELEDTHFRGTKDLSDIWEQLDV